VRRGKEKSVAVMVDSAISSSYINILPQLRLLVEEIGKIKIAKIIIMQEQAFETAKDISDEGFLPVIVHDDLDIHFALELMELIYNEKIQTLAIVTENEKFLPLFGRARELGKEVILLQATGNVGRGLQNAADLVLPIGD
jgi:uncharacterized protein (TIGR00288 family)